MSGAANEPATASLVFMSLICYFIIRFLLSSMNSLAETQKKYKDDKLHSIGELLLLVHMAMLTMPCVWLGKYLGLLLYRLLT